MEQVVICILHDDKEGCKQCLANKASNSLGLHKDWAADGLIPCKPDTENYDYAVKERNSLFGTDSLPTGKPPKELGHFEFYVQYHVVGLPLWWGNLLSER